MRRLPSRLIVISLALVVGLVALALASLSTVWRASGFTKALAQHQLDALEKTEYVEDLIFQKGFIATYLVTGDSRWLDELNRRKKATAEWLEQVDSNVTAPQERKAALKLRAAYDAYNASRDTAITLYQEGKVEEAVRALDSTQGGMDKVLAAAKDLTRYHRGQLLATLDRGERVFQRAQWLIAILTAATALLCIGIGVWATLRIARPIYELTLQVESVQSDRVRVETDAFDSTNELGALTHNVRRLIDELDEQRRRLVQAEKMESLGHIAAKLAHEILNPVAGAKVALQAVSRTTTLPDTTKQTMQEVDRALSRIDGILSRLVRYARPLEPRRQLCEVDDLIARALESSSHEATARRVRIRTTPSALPLVDVDPQLVGQVLTNLLVNACQASPPESEVELRASKDGSSLRFQVLDRGHGLPAQREKLFQPFFTTREKGNGLGLATCQNIVAEHGGRIEAANRGDGAGAVFTVWLPQRNAAWRSLS